MQISLNASYTIFIFRLVSYIIGVTSKYNFVYKIHKYKMRKLWFHMHPCRKKNKKIIINSIWVNSLAWLSKKINSLNRYIELKIRQNTPLFYDGNHMLGSISDLCPGGRRNMNHVPLFTNRRAFSQPVWGHHHWSFQAENSEINFEVT